MKILPLMLFIGCFLAACASTPSTSEEERAKIDGLFAATGEEDNLVTCLSVHQYDSVQIVNDQLLLFKGTGDRVWANELATRCPGLRRDDLLVFDLHGSQVCKLDTFTANDRGGWSFMRQGPRCALGEFMPIGPEIVSGINAVLQGR